jgi:hypothetical protein
LCAVDRKRERKTYKEGEDQVGNVKHGAVKMRATFL